MSYFRQLAQATLNPATDAAFGEPVTVTPMRTRPNYPAERDPTRREVEAVAVFTNPTAFAFGDGVASHGRLRHDNGGFLPVATRTPSFSLAAVAVPGLRRGDVIRRQDATGYEVKAARPDGVARVAVDVTELGLPNQTDL